VRKIGFFRKKVTSLFDEPSESARRMLLACAPATMSFWVDHKADIHGDVPDKFAHICVRGRTSPTGTACSDNL